MEAEDTGFPVEGQPGLGLQGQAESYFGKQVASQSVLVPKPV